MEAVEEIGYPYANLITSDGFTYDSAMAAERTLEDFDKD